MVSTQKTNGNFIDVFGLPNGDFTFKVSAYNSLYQSVSIDLDISLTKTTIGWDTVVGFDYDDNRISNDSAISAASIAAQTKADLAEVRAKAYADGIVTTEENRAIADATNKANTAQANAILASASAANSKISGIQYEMAFYSIQIFYCLK